MTYDPNDPRRPVVVESDGMSAGAMAGIAFALLLFLGVMFWAFASGDRQTASTTVRRRRPPASVHRHRLPRRYPNALRRPRRRLSSSSEAQRRSKGSP